MLTNASAQVIQKVKMDDVVTLLDTSKGPVMVNFFATWCSPCVHELPYFEKEAAEKKVKLVLVSLDFAESVPNGIRSFMNKNKYRSTVYWLSDTNADEYCPKIDRSWNGAIPVTIMVNNTKKIRQFYGFQLTEERLVAELKKLVD